MQGKCGNEEEDLNRVHSIPRVLEYKGGSDICGG
jgi:hypothetical protein